MSQKEQLIYLIKEYYAGKYSTVAFCDEFTRVLCMEKDGSLTEEENLLLSKSDGIFSRFSPYDEDVRTGFLFGEEKIQQEFHTLVDKLNIKL